jgi:hypothetical protein
LLGISRGVARRKFRPHYHVKNFKSRTFSSVIHVTNESSSP